MSDIDVNRPSPWMSDDAPDRDVVLSSRVRFARNLDGVPFDARAELEDKQSVRSDVHDVLAREGAERDWHDVHAEEVDRNTARILVERRLASDELFEDPAGGVFYTPDESLSVLVNEEDHVRLQALAGGSRVDEAFSEAHRLERDLDSHLPFAYDDQWGFLTSCPTNVGTGLRASVLLHLPGLVMTRKIERVLKAVSNLGLTVRGVAGEGSESRGFYFQLSNQVTLGQSAEEMRDNLKRVTGQITDQERQARQSLANEEPIEPFDQVWRSYGMLRYARSVDTTEALETLSHVRLGVDLGWIEEPDLGTIDGLMILTQPAHLNKSHDGNLNAEERDRIRATRLRNTFSTAEPAPEDSDDRADSSGSSSRTHEK